MVEEVEAFENSTVIHATAKRKATEEETNNKRHTTKKKPRFTTTHKFRFSDSFLHSCRYISATKRNPRANGKKNEKHAHFLAMSFHFAPKAR